MSRTFSGVSEAAVLLRKIASFGDPRLYALSLVAEYLSHSSQPLVPERMFVAGANRENGHVAPSYGMLGMLINLLVAEQSGFQVADTQELATLKEFADRMSRDSLESLTRTALATSATETTPAAVPQK